ncbi:MAG: hypothetical protein LBC07_03340 [Elusimicrobiota bacterium]|jgi:hypothetical protein|nr:hypothetical protein [Elusimicrobiota bacterium]
MEEFGLIISKILKFFSAMVLTAFFVTLVNYYDGLLTEVDELGKTLNMYVFFTKNVQDPVEFASQLEALDIVKVKEVVAASEVYKRAIEKNPYLATITVGDTATAFEGYVIAFPIKTPTQESLTALEKDVYKVDGTDELAFDKNAFLKYGRLLTQLSIYRYIAFGVVGIFALFFIISFFVISFTQSWQIGDFFLTFGMYMLAGICGFGIVWFASEFFLLPFALDIASFAPIVLAALAATVFTK